ncbi:hypothetical protein OUZ56_031152 [Daphnia magna]|uniref:Uncharacterized protein n=1 Tax=Daphnia magna TaxID=35525 RepID=A0ABQ9ZTX7_9CRUS|nr:hypothetical protein OUZ56_031152 [Daphnia magna]
MAKLRRHFWAIGRDTYRPDDAYRQLTEWTLTATYETNLTLEQNLRTANYNKMYPPWPLPGIHCGGHFDNAHYLLNQKVYFPTWMENAANTLNANLKLWLTSILSAEATSNNNKCRPDDKCHLETIGVVWTISVAPYWPKVTAQLCHRLRPDVRDHVVTSTCIIYDIIKLITSSIFTHCNAAPLYSPRSTPQNLAPGCNPRTIVLYSSYG